MLNRRLGSHPHLTDLGKTLSNNRVRDITHLNNVRDDGRKFIEIVAPLFGNGVRVFEVFLVQPLHVGRVTPGDVRALPQCIHGAILHHDHPEARRLMSRPLFRSPRCSVA